MMNSTMLIAAVALFSAAGPLAAQSGFVVTIKTPQEWEFNRQVSLKPGTALQITGSAKHPSGIKKVVVNGRDATLKQDPQNKVFWLFSAAIPADSVMSQVTITYFAINGDSARKNYSTNSQLVANAEPPKPVAAPITVPVREETVAPVPSVPARLPDAWQPFRRRSIVYGIAGGAGLLVMAMNKSETTCAQSPLYNCSSSGNSVRTLGVALAGGAIAALAIDAFLTSRRSHDGKALASSREGSTPERRFEMPQIVDIGNGVGLELVRLRFH